MVWIKALESDKVKIIGFVESIDKIFSESMCFAAPLTLGAGIKIKVIEAMYAGIPVLTNDIGMEGIPAIAGRDYYHCSTPEDYADIIRRLCEENSTAVTGKALIEQTFSLEESFHHYYKTIEGLVKNK